MPSRSRENTYTYMSESNSTDKHSGQGYSNPRSSTLPIGKYKPDAFSLMSYCKPKVEQDNPRLNQ